MFCPHCGKETFLVSDYNVMDDWLENHIKENIRPIHKEEEKKENLIEEEQVWNLLKKRKKPLAFLSVFVFFLGMFLGNAVSRYQNKHSFSYNYQKTIQMVQEKDYRRALKYVIRASFLNPDNISARIYKEKILCEMNRYEEAELAFSELSAAEKEKRSEELLRIYEKREKYEELARFLENTKESWLKEKFSKYQYSELSFVQKEKVYENQLNLKLTATNGGTIYYTLDGSRPGIGSRKYRGEILLEKGRTLVRAVCQNEFGVFGKEISGVFTVVSTIPNKPKVFPESGDYENGVSIFLVLEEGMQAYYTLDGSTPTEDSIPYDGNIEMPLGTTVFSAIVVNEDGKKSQVVQKIYHRTK